MARHLCAMFDPAFLKGETWGFPAEAVEHVETHAAHVFLVHDRAFKIKKDVKLPYLDFSDPQKRRVVLEQELEINRLFTPDIYLAVSNVLGEPVLVMRRFPSQALLAWQIAHGGVGSTMARRLAAMVAESHKNAPRRDVPGKDIMSGLGAQLSAAFIDSPDIFHPAETLEYHALFESALNIHKVLLNERNARGLVRRCHGDMHPGNIIVEDGVPKLFDAIEFSEKIATIDVLYDLAFLLMGLWTEGERHAANRVLNHYLDLRRREEDLTGLALLPMFLSTRAGVRALVTADLAHELTLSRSMKQRSQAMDWFRAGLAYLRPARPLLVCIGGLSGTGKSTVAAELAADIGAAPGALHVRSDIERKVLAGVEETARLAAEHYSREASFCVYEACLGRAEKALRARHSVVIDAVFARAEERRAVEDLARSCNAGFAAAWLEAPADLLKARVAARRGDASDATPAVVEMQTAYDLGPLHWPRISAAGTPAETLMGVRGMLPSLPGGPA
jgi:aminoglycoside phosphotransferase family enzyme/predicted kinase